MVFCRGPFDLYVRDQMFCPYRMMVHDRDECAWSSFRRYLRGRRGGNEYVAGFEVRMDLIVFVLVVWVVTLWRLERKRVESWMFEKERNSNAVLVTLVFVGALLLLIDGDGCVNNGPVLEIELNLILSESRK